MTGFITLSLMLVALMVVLLGLFILVGLSIALLVNGIKLIIRKRG
jgi:hypothetical protein